MAERQYKSFEEFWPFYLSEHSKPATRWFHFFGTGLMAINLVWSIATFHFLYILFCPVIAYGAAWFSHFFIEKNRPATFTYPLWSLMGDFKMWGLMATGRIGAELQRLHIAPAA